MTRPTSRDIHSFFSWLTTWANSRHLSDPFVSLLSDHPTNPTTCCDGWWWNINYLRTPSEAFWSMRLTFFWNHALNSKLLLRWFSMLSGFLTVVLLWTRASYRLGRWSEKSSRIKIQASRVHALRYCDSRMACVLRCVSYLLVHIVKLVGWLVVAAWKWWLKDDETDVKRYPFILLLANNLSEFEAFVWSVRLSAFWPTQLITVSLPFPLWLLVEYHSRVLLYFPWWRLAL
jgi:hypothetical protein